MTTASDSFGLKLTTMTYEVTGRIARITLNRPHRGNGITLEMPQELALCVERSASRSLRCDAQAVTAASIPQAASTSLPPE